jgi:hypothetical protein
MLLVASVLLARLARPWRVASTVTWDCGYAAPSPRMQYTSSSFAEFLVGMFSWALRPREHAARLTTIFPRAESYHSEVLDTVLERAVMPVSRVFGRVVVWFRWVQHGQIHLYILYILFTLILTLLLLR